MRILTSWSERFKRSYVWLLAAGGVFEVTLRLAWVGPVLFRIICNDRLLITVTNILSSKSRDYLSFLNAQWHSGSCQLTINSSFSWRRRQNQPLILCVVVTNIMDNHDVRGSVRHSVIHIKNPIGCNSISKFISYLYEAQRVSGDTPPSIIRSLKLHWQSLVLHTWKVVGRLVAGRCPTTFHVCKTRGCQCSFRLLVMGGVSPETCWASYKYEINFDTLLHLVGFLLYERWIMLGI